MEHLRIVEGETRHTVRPILNPARAFAQRAFAICTIAASLSACGAIFDDGTPPPPEALNANAPTETVETAAPSRNAAPSASRPTAISRNPNASTPVSTNATTPTTTASPTTPRPRRPRRPRRRRPARPARRRRPRLRRRRSRRISSTRSCRT